MWLHRFASQETVFAALSPALLALPDGSDYSSDLHPDWHDLRQTRDALDEVIEQWLAGMVPDFLSSTMRRGAQEMGEGVKAEPGWDMTSQSPPDYPTISALPGEFAIGRDDCAGVGLCPSAAWRVV